MKINVACIGAAACMAALVFAPTAVAQGRPPVANEATADARVRCLTGNATGTLAVLNVKIPGEYTYYDGLTDSEFFPNVAFDKQRSAGWVPFTNGVITDGSGSSVSWAKYWLGANGIDVVFDLKGEYVISRVVVSPARRLGLSLKSEGEPRYTLAALQDDPLAAVAQETDEDGTNAPPEPVMTGVMEGIHAPARWVRLHRQYSRGVSLEEIQIWGYPRPAGETIPRKPLIRGGAVTGNPREVPIQNTDDIRVTDDILVFPIPQEMNRTGSDFALTPATRILYFPGSSRSCRTSAEVLQDELARETGLKLEIQAAQSAQAVNGAILLAEPATAPVDLKAEGYTLVCDQTAVLIAGDDERGAFYGTQTLLQLLQHRAERWTLAGVKIRDWPECPIRLIQGRREVSEELIRALARFKINYYQFIRFGEEESRLVPLADKYRVKLMINAPPHMVIGQHPEFVELNPGEKLADLEASRINFCPSHPKLWDAYFGELDKWIDKSNSDYIFINFDEMYQGGSGSRWNVCDYCRARNMHSWELMGWTLNTLSDHFARHGKKIYMMDTCFMGKSISNKEDTDTDWRKALDIVPTNILMGVWHPELVNKLFGDKGFPQLFWGNPNGKESQFPATTAPGIRYAGINVNMLDAPFTYRGFLSLPQESWSPSRAFNADELTAQAVDKFMPLLRKILEDRVWPSEQAKPEQFFAVDLAQAANRSFKDDIPDDGRGWFDMGANYDLRSIKPGRRSLGGIPFDVIDESANNGKGCLMLYNRGYMNPDMPGTAEFAVGRKAASLLFLHTIMQSPGQNYMRKNEFAGSYFIVYDNGRYSTFDIKYGMNIQPWLGGVRDADGKFPAPMSLGRGRVVWRGETVGGHAAHLAFAEWINPFPDQTIRKVICRTAWKKSPMNLALVAVTGVTPTGNEATETVKLPAVSDIALAAPKGIPVDLSGGTEKSFQWYVAPDGTIVESSRIFRLDEYHGGSEDVLGTAACAIKDGNHYFRPSEYLGEVTVWFPEVVFLKGFMIRCPPREERKRDDFPPSAGSWTISISPDEKTWKPVGTLALREEQGPQFFALPALEDIKALRIEGPGVVGLTLYK